MNELPEDPKFLIGAMKQTDTLEFFEDLVLLHTRRKLQKTSLPHFIDELSKDSCECLLAAVQQLYTSVNWFLEYANAWENAEKLKNDIRDVLQACLTWEIPQAFPDNFSKLYTYCFQFDLWQKDNSHGSMDTDACDDCNDGHVYLQWRDTKTSVNSSSFAQTVMMPFYNMVQTWLPSLDLMHKFCELPVMSMLETEIDRYIVKTCSGEFEQKWVEEDDGQLENWLQSHVMSWLDELFLNGYNRKTWKQTLLHFVYASYTKLRISEMLNIITDFPESSPVLSDLRTCLQYTRLRPRLIGSLKDDFKNRVLHPGVSTQNIISVYISAVKALRELDPTGVMMEMVLEPCTTYLTEREDAVRMIMQGLLGDDGSNDLAAELAKRQEPNDGLSCNESATKCPEDWLPDPREADPNKADKSSRTSDIVTLFIRMYGSKEKFIKEYQKLLSKRLLQTWYTEKDESAEIRNLELLKMRFGEDDMNKCEVMLKDVKDSKRINQYVKDEFYKKENVEPPVEVRPIIVSSQFWPEIPNQEYEMPQNVTDALGLFTKGFESLKASRSLKCMTGVGLVDLDLEFKHRTINLRVQPVQASIICHFQEQDEWSLADLGDVLKIPPTVLRRKMSFWIQQGIIRETKPDSYTVVETGESSPPGSSGVSSMPVGAGLSTTACVEEDEDEGANSDVEKEKREKEEKIFWNYVQGMLKNFESLPIDKIHKMLQMFTMHDADMQISVGQLRDLLDKKVQSSLLTFEQGKYKLVRDST